MNCEARLPPEFAELEPFVDDWVRNSNDERWHRRSTASMQEIRRFYDAMLARAEDAIAYLDRFALHDMPEDATRLFKMLLALAHAAIAVEMHGLPRARHSIYPHRIHVTNGPAPHGGANSGRGIMNQ